MPLPRRSFRFTPPRDPTGCTAATIVRNRRRANLCTFIGLRPINPPSNRADSPRLLSSGPRNWVWLQVAPRGGVPLAPAVDQIAGPVAACGKRGLTPSDLSFDPCFSEVSSGLDPFFHRLVGKPEIIGTSSTSAAGSHPRRNPVDRQPGQMPQLLALAGTRRGLPAAE